MFTLWPLIKSWLKAPAQTHLSSLSLKENRLPGATATCYTWDHHPQFPSAVTDDGMWPSRISAIISVWVEEAKAPEIGKKTHVTHVEVSHCAWLWRLCCCIMHLSFHPSIQASILPSSHLLWCHRVQLRAKCTKTKAGNKPRTGSSPTQDTLHSISYSQLMAI